MIIVGLTTIPERLEKGVIKKSIKSILNQTIKVDYIVVNIPKVSCKGIKYNYDAAQELSKLDEKIIIRWGIDDEGPITKLFGTLDFIKSKEIINGKIILVDDDVKYHKLAFKYLISENYPAVGFVGRELQTYIKNDNKNNELVYYDEKKPGNIDFLETFASVCYDINLFNINDMRLWIKQLPSETFYVDDIVIGAWLWKNNIKPRIIKISKNLKLYYHDAENTQELSTNNLKYRNIKVFLKLYSLCYFRDRKPIILQFKDNNNKIIITFVTFVIFIILIIFVMKKI
jgi:hypothetical protein